MSHKVIKNRNQQMARFENDVSTLVLTYFDATICFNLIGLSSSFSTSFEGQLDVVGKSYSLSLGSRLFVELFVPFVKK